MAGRVLRSRSIPAAEEVAIVGAPAGNEADLVKEVVVPRKKAAPKRNAAPRPPAVRGRGPGRGRGRGRSVAIPAARSETRVEGLASVQVEGQGFVTKEAFDDKMGRIKKALQTLLVEQKKATRGSKSGSAMSIPDETVGDEHSHWTPSVKTVQRKAQGCSYKEFAACKPPTFKG
ncbi:hypothetical protein OSB04_019031 [Centaurea solstitialis]|uniref:Uncharacterized protein n=1 Tax=Centaurea solstitialis TaxID=347529 RepID=A0AA38T910_9ASTR|nr:hypothetical protein OSB04_019031 [Centaurea solstitialis]